MTPGLLPAARAPYGAGEPAQSAFPHPQGASTPVFDRLIAEWRRDFRTVPGDAWAPSSPPNFASIGAPGDRFALPGGGPGFGY